MAVVEIKINSQKLSVKKALRNGIHKLSCKVGNHKWAYIYQEVESEFLGKKVTSYEEKFRVCLNCGRAEMYQDGKWKELSPKEAEVLSECFEANEEKGMFILKKNC